MSTRCITCPPRSFPRGFVCAGSTISVISERDTLTGFPRSPVSGSRLLSFFRFIQTSCLAMLDAAGSTRIIRDDAMTDQKKTRRQMLEEFVAGKPDDAFSRYGLAMECMNSGDAAAADTPPPGLASHQPEVGNLPRPNRSKLFPLLQRAGGFEGRGLRAFRRGDPLFPSHSQLPVRLPPCQCTGPRQNRNPRVVHPL